MWPILPEVAVIVFNNNFTVLDDQQTIDKLMRRDFIDRLFTSLKFDGKIIDEIITLFEYQESIGMPRDINRRDHFPHMTKRPAINRPELERFEG
ncbi:hypothetical protein N9R68_03040 [Porticoccaceae bacterium]|nr:hypothetical protein [Porticoccaceae bacterium]